MNKSFLPLLLSVCLAYNVFGQEQRKEWKVEEIFGGAKFAMKSLSGVQWVSGERKFSYLETDSVTRTRNIYTYNVADGIRELILDGSLLIVRGDEKPRLTDSVHKGGEAMRIGSYEWPRTV